MEDDDRRASSRKHITIFAWWQIALHVKRAVIKDRVGFISAGVAFYMLIALVPTMAATLSIYSLISDPGEVPGQIQTLRDLAPEDAIELIDDEMMAITNDEKLAGWGLVVGILIALWGASKAVNALMVAISVAHNETIPRRYFRRRIIGLCLTGGAIVLFVLITLLLGGVPAVLAFAGLDTMEESIISLLRWPVLFTTIVFALSALYRFALAKRSDSWRWISVGSVSAALIWVTASAGFSYYATHFGNYSKSYGSLGAVVLLLLWFYITGYVTMLGAEINAEIELQKARGRPPRSQPPPESNETTH